MFKVFIASATLLALLASGVSFAWSRGNGTGYYNAHNFTVNSNGTVTATPKYRTS
jgi:hypothetical protein